MTHSVSRHFSKPLILHRVAEGWRLPQHAKFLSTVSKKKVICIGMLLEIITMLYQCEHEQWKTEECYVKDFLNEMVRWLF